MTRKRWPMILGAALLGIVAIVTAAGYAATMAVVGHFAPTLQAIPADYGLAAEVIHFRSLDGIDLKGWWIPAQGPRAATEVPIRGTVVLAHGKGNNRSSMLSRAASLALNGYNALPIDLRAHGESGGGYMTPGYLEALDILGAVDAAKRRGQKGPFVALGHSYGGVASLWAAARSREISAVVADGAFVSIASTLKRRATQVANNPDASFRESLRLRLASRLSESSWARRFFEWAFYARTGVRIVPQYDDSLEAASQIRETPVLFIVGQKDAVAHPDDARQMYSVAGNSMNAILIVPGADHDSTFSADPDLYKATLVHFLTTALGSRTNHATSALH